MVLIGFIQTDENNVICSSLLQLTCNSGAKTDVYFYC